MAIRNFPRCSPQAADLVQRAAGRIKIYYEPGWGNWGAYTSEDDTLYLWAGLWADDQGGNFGEGMLISAWQLGQTLVHESIHAWWSGAWTSSHPPEFDEIMDACF